jgi:ABC-type antimicrobial peptide transport system permease subunit
VVVQAEKLMPSLLASIRSAVMSKSSQSVIFGPQTMDEVISDSLAARRSSMMLLNLFAAVALLLASVGLYGVISYLVGQRTQEFGIRLTLGAQPKDLFRLVLGHGLKMALGGVALGLIAALLLTRLMANMLYGVSATDPATFVIIALLLMAVAVLASLVPARRATKVDPMLALRSE